MVEKPENPVEFTASVFRVLPEKWRGISPLQGKFGGFRSRRTPQMRTFFSKSEKLFGPETRFFREKGPFFHKYDFCWSLFEKCRIVPRHFSRHSEKKPAGNNYGPKNDPFLDPSRAPSHGRKTRKSCRISGYRISGFGRKMEGGGPPPTEIWKRGEGPSKGNLEVFVPDGPPK